MKEAGTVRERPIPDHGDSLGDDVFAVHFGQGIPNEAFVRLAEENAVDGRQRWLIGRNIDSC